MFVDHRFAMTLRSVLLVGQCQQVLDVWGPPIFHIADITNNTPLTTIVYTTLKVSIVIVFT